MPSSIEIDVSANIAKFATAMNKAAGEGKKLNQKLDRSFKKINGAMKKLGTLAGVAVAGGIANMGKKSIDSADKIGKLSQRLGASSEALSQYRHVADLSGVSFDTLTMGWQRMTRRVSEAANGTGEAKGAIEELGISATALNKLAPDKQFEVLADAIHGVKNPADQVRLAMKLFDSEGVSLIQTMQDGSKGIREMREEAVGLGLSLSQDQVQAAAEAKDALSKLTSSISGSFSQTILNYTDEIKRAADFTREYLPRSIEFLIDIFRQLKAIVQRVVLAVLNHFEMLFKAAEKLPIVGKNFKGVANFFQDASDIIQIHLKENVAEMGKWRKQSIEVNKETENMAKAINQQAVPALGDLRSVAKPATEEAKKTTKAMKGLAESGKSVADSLPKKQVQDFTGTLKSVRDQLIETTRKQQEFDKALQDGTIKSVREAIAVAAELGVEYENLSNKGVTAAEIIRDGWKDFSSSLEGVFKSAREDGERFFKSLKNVAFDILGQIADKIAATFAINTIQKLLGGTQLGNYLQISNGGGGSNLLGQAVQAGTTKGVSAALQGTKLGSALGSGSGSGTLIGNGINAAFGGASGSTTVGNAINSLASAFGVGSAATTGSAFATSAAATGGFATGSAGATALAATQGLATSAAAQTAAISALSTTVATSATATGAAAAAGASAGAAAGATAGTTSAAAGLTATGYGAIVVAIVAAIAALSGNSRSPQELGLDQLQAVDEATRAGRNTQVSLGSTAGISSSLLGGFDENSVFFGVDLAKEQLQKVGDIFKRITGANQALALKDGVIRIEDFNRKFSDSHETVVSQLKASIAEYKLGFTQVERSSLSSLGNMLTKLDGIFDRSANSGLSNAERVTQAWVQGYGITTEEANKALNSIGLSSDRIAEIFTNTSNDTLNQLVGITNQADTQTARIQGLFERRFSSIQSTVNATTGSIVTNLGNQSEALIGNIKDLVDELKEAKEEEAFARAARA